MPLVAVTSTSRPVSTARSRDIAICWYGLAGAVVGRVVGLHDQHLGAAADDVADQPVVGDLEADDVADPGRADASGCPGRSAA